MLGLVSAGQQVDPSAVEWLLSAQAPDGGWGSPDATGISLHVLAALDQDQYGEAIQSAVESLQATQQTDGGWGFDSPSSVNSTSEVMQGLTAAGENPFDPTWSVVTSGTLRNGADFALAQQGANGCWPNLFGEGDDPYATTDGIILLSLAPPWGAVAQGEEPEEAAATQTVPATAEPAETLEAVVEATEVVPSPTALPDVAEATVETEVAQVTATAAPQDTAAPTLTPTADDRGASTGNPLLWVALGAGLLVLVVAYFVYQSRR
jgi:hypothetical protein